MKTSQNSRKYRFTITWEKNKKVLQYLDITWLKSKKWSTLVCYMYAAYNLPDNENKIKCSIINAHFLTSKFVFKYIKQQVHHYFITKQKLSLLKDLISIKENIWRLNLTLMPFCILISDHTIHGCPKHIS